MQRRTHGATRREAESVHPLLRQVPCPSIDVVLDQVVLICLVKDRLDQVVPKLGDRVCRCTGIGLLVKVLCELFGRLRLGDGSQLLSAEDMSAFPNSALPRSHDVHTYKSQTSNPV